MDNTIRVTLRTGQQEIILPLLPGDPEHWIEKTKEHYGEVVAHNPEQVLWDGRRCHWMVRGFEVRKQPFDPLDMDLKDLVMTVFVTLLDPAEARLGEFIHLDALQTGREIQGKTFQRTQSSWVCVRTAKEDEEQ